MLECCRALAKFFAKCAEHCAHARRLGVRHRQQPFESPFFGNENKRLAGRCFRRKVGKFASPSQEIQQRRVTLREAGPCSGSSAVDQGIDADEFSWQTAGAGCNLGLLRGLRREPKKVSRGDPGRKNGPAPCGELHDGSRIRSALAKGGITGAVINALAKSVDGSGSCEPRKGLGNCREGQFAKVLQPPKPLAGLLDPSADRLGSISGILMGCKRSHVDIMAHFGTYVKFLCHKT